MMPRVLICDDDPEIRHAMRRTLRGYDVFEAASVREAMELMRSSPFIAVVADLSIDTEADGLDLLQFAKLMFPDTVRLLVTGTRDLGLAVRALNEQAIDRFFPKPWNDEMIAASLAIAIAGRTRVVN